MKVFSFKTCFHLRSQQLQNPRKGLPVQPAGRAAASNCSLSQCLRSYSKSLSLWPMTDPVIQDMAPQIHLNKLPEKPELRSWAVTEWETSYYSKGCYAKWPIIFYWFSVLFVRKSWVHNPRWSCGPWKWQLKPAAGLVEEWDEDSNVSSAALFM